jgi:hypothetical protein
LRPAAFLDDQVPPPLEGSEKSFILLPIFGIAMR